MNTDTAGTSGWQIAALAFAMGFPLLVAWVYFVVLATGGQANAVQRFAYAGGKVVQFAFPVLFLWLVGQHFPRLAWPTWGDLTAGLLLGAAAAGVILALYFGLLRQTPLLQDTPERVRGKMAEFGLTTATAYLLFAVFLSAAHSLLEEYYWRWFVFGQLRHVMPVAAAAVLAAVAFAAHHVVVLSVFLPGRFASAVVPAALAVAAGGVAWAWLYQQTGSLWPAWVSHALVDGAIFSIGWYLMRR